MGKFTEALRREAEAREAEVRAAIRDLDDKALAAWCRKSIGGHRATIAHVRAIIDLKAIIALATTREDEGAALKLARESGRWFDALIEVAKDRRTRGDAIPISWRDYLSDCHIGVVRRPDGRGKKNQSARDEAICRCIRDIVSHTRFKATRNEASGDKPCAVSIVAAALGEMPGYEGVERIWLRRPDRFG